MIVENKGAADEDNDENSDDQEDNTLLMAANQKNPFGGGAQGQGQMASPALLGNMRRPADEGQNNENEGLIMCQSCCGAVFNALCFPCCLCGGCNRVTVKQGEAGLMIRNGRFYKSLPPGIYIINTCLYEIRHISVKSRVAQHNGNNLITKDNMSVSLDIYINYEVKDPFVATIGISQLDGAISTIASGKLKYIISVMKFQELLRSSAKINGLLKQALENDLGGLGISVFNAEVTAINMSKELMLSMAQVAISEREKDAQVRLARANLETSKVANEAASILKDQQNSMDLHFFDTIKHVAKSWNETVITADGMLYIPDKYTQKK